MADSTEPSGQQAEPMTSVHPLVAAMTGLFQVTWPAFLGAAIGSGILFSAIDPAELRVVDKYLAGSAAGAYTVGFFLLFAVMVLACGMTYMLVRPDKKDEADNA